MPVPMEREFPVRRERKGMSNKEKYMHIFEEIFEVEASTLDDSFTFSQTDKWDSITHLTLITELEETFDVVFETDDILHFGGYMNGMSILKRYGVKFED